MILRKTGGGAGWPKALVGGGQGSGLFGNPAAVYKKGNMWFVHFKLQDRAILQKVLKYTPAGVHFCGCVLEADCLN